MGKIGMIAHIDHSKTSLTLAVIRILDMAKVSQTTEKLIGIAKEADVDESVAIRMAEKMEGKYEITESQPVVKNQMRTQPAANADEGAKATTEPATVQTPSSNTPAAKK